MESEPDTSYAHDIDFELNINGHNPITAESLLTEKEREERAQRLVGKWQVFTIKDAYRERPPRKYVIEGLLPRPSLSIVFGGPGSLKSMLLADMCICAALGKQWLEHLPGDKQKGIAFATNSTPFLWIDFDNGKDGSHERFEAVAKAHGVPADFANAHYVSMPTPWLDASKPALISELAELINERSVKLVVIDNLGLVTGDTEENSAKMAQVTGNLRWLCEETGAAIIVIHHQRKSGGNTDKLTRKGESLRGHSSIEAALDLALCVERKEGCDQIAVIPTKVRGYTDFTIFGARFTYEHKPGTKELAIARFFAEQAMSIEEAAILKISNAVRNILLANGAMNQRDIVNEVRDQLAAEPGGKAPPINKVRGILKNMTENDEIEESGTGGKRVYQCIRKHY